MQQTWMHKYPLVQAMLQGADEPLDDASQDDEPQDDEPQDDDVFCPAFNAAVRHSPAVIDGEALLCQPGTNVKMEGGALWLRFEAGAPWQRFQAVASGEAVQAGAVFYSSYVWNPVG